VQAAHGPSSPSALSTDFKHVYGSLNGPDQIALRDEDIDLVKVCAELCSSFVAAASIGLFARRPVAALVVPALSLSNPQRGDHAAAGLVLKAIRSPRALTPAQIAQELGIDGVDEQAVSQETGLAGRCASERRAPAQAGRCRTPTGDGRHKACDAQSSALNLATTLASSVTPPCAWRCRNSARKRPWAAQPRAWSPPKAAPASRPRIRWRTSTSTPALPGGRHFPVSCSWLASITKSSTDLPSPMEAERLMASSSEAFASDRWPARVCTAPSVPSVLASSLTAAYRCSGFAACLRSRL